MSEAPNAVALVRNELDALTQPLRDLVARLDEQIEEKQAELDGLKHARRTATRALAAADPHATPGPTPRTKREPQRISRENMQLLEGWLEDHRAELDGDTFTVRSMMGDHGFDLFSRSVLAWGLKELHEVGKLRLDSVGQGGAKRYVLV